MKTLVPLVLVCSFATAAVLTVVVRKIARRIGFVDRPKDHKSHDGAIALGGGISFTLTILAPLVLGVVLARIWSGGDAPSLLPDLVRLHLAGIASKMPAVLGITGCALLLHIVGLIDDRRPLGPRAKFVAQLVAAIVTAGPLGIRAAEFLPVPLSVGLTVLWIVLMANAFNFLDNMDGLAAGVAAIACAIFAAASMQAGQVFVPVLCWLIVGSLGGFLLFNFSPATIFMGDAGSMVIGYLLGAVTILTTFYDPEQHTKPMGLLVPLVVLAVPLYDVTSVVVHRLRIGVSPFRGDQRHFSHRLVKRGLSKRGAVLTIYLATAATGLPAIALPLVDWALATILLVQCACVVGIIAILEHVEPPRRDLPPAKEAHSPGDERAGASEGRALEGEAPSPTSTSDFL